MTCYLVAGLDLEQGRFLLRADIQNLGAAGMKAAAFRRIDW